jgi:hypothetical protein
VDYDNGLLGVVVRCQENPGVMVRLHSRYVPDELGVGFSIDVQAPGLQACVDGIEVWVWDEADLPGFVAGLASDFQGWTGERIWQTNHLTIQAEYHSRGHVRLTWTLRPWVSRDDSWRATVTTWLEAGEQMRNLADELALFLRDRRGPRSTGGR